MIKRLLCLFLAISMIFTSGIVEAVAVSLDSQEEQSEQVTVPIGEERNDLELGMDAYGWVDFMNITILEGEEAEETVPETTVAEEVPETTEALEETEPETTAVPEETTPVTTAAPEETVPVAPNPGNPGNTALIVGICMMVAALVIVAVVFLRKKK